MRMKLLLLCIFFSLGCQKDDEIDPVVGSNALHYDGFNQSAPAVVRGISYAAVRFPADELIRMGQVGKSLTSIDYYVQDVPQSMKVLIMQWNDQDHNEPGGVLYQSTIDDREIDGNRWNRYTLGQPVTLPDMGLWITFEIDSGDQDLRVIGCDPGPRHENGDVYGVFGDNLPGWSSLYSFSDQQVNVNWNIRGFTQ